MAIVLLVAVIGLLTSAETASAESNSTVTVHNSSNANYSSSVSNSCSTDITVNGQHFHSDQCDVNIKDDNGNVNTSPTAPKSPTPPTTPSPPFFQVTPPAKPIPPKFPNTFPFNNANTQTSQISQQISDFVAHLQQEISNFFHIFIHS